MNRTIRSSVYNLFVCVSSCVALCLSGCMAGGTRGTGLAYSSFSDDGTLLMKVKLVGKIEYSNGKIARGVNVEAVTKGGTASTSTVSTKSDGAGKFSLDLEFISGEPIVFSFKSNTVNASVTAVLSPEGKDTVVLRFVLDKFGKMEVLE